MSEKTTFVCIGCPIGCPLQLEHVGDRIEEISGHQCNRGAKYAKQEFTDPRRELSTTIAVEGGLWERLPVKVAGPVPKEKVLRVARAIHRVKVKAPIELGQVVLDSSLDGEPLKVVATRSMPAREPEENKSAG